MLSGRDRTRTYDLTDVNREALFPHLRPHGLPITVAVWSAFPLEPCGLQLLTEGCHAAVFQYRVQSDYNMRRSASQVDARLATVRVNATRFEPRLC